MSQWINLKDFPLDPQKDSGHYVVLINGNPHVVYFEFRNWNSPWHIPTEWSQPTHYIKLNDIPNFWWTKRDKCIMD